MALAIPGTIAVPAPRVWWNRWRGSCSARFDRWRLTAVITEETEGGTGGGEGDDSAGEERCWLMVNVYDAFFDVRRIDALS